MTVTDTRHLVTSNLQRRNGKARHSSVGGPVSVAWREGTLTRAKELESLAAWLNDHRRSPGSSADMFRAIDQHLAAAREAAEREHRRPWFLKGFNGPLLERAISNLDAAEADLLQLAPADHLLGQMPSLLNQVQRHLAAPDPRRREFEHLAQELGVKDPDLPPYRGSIKTVEEKQALIDVERSKIVSVVRGASSAGLREQLRVRSFRNVVIATTLVLMVLAILLAVLGVLGPATVPLCFQPERAGATVLVCPTAQSIAAPAAQPDVDELVQRTVHPYDLLIVEFIGLIAAAVAAAAAIRNIRGSSEPHSLPVALALLKLPTGAITAVLGLLLIRGQFLPGLSALDTPGQILAWALVFGYAQQLLTRFVDQQAHTVLDSVRGAERSARQPT